MDTHIHRRTILRTSVRLAYATPLVVASMQIPASHAAACSCDELTPPCFEEDLERNCIRLIGGDGCELDPGAIPFLCPD